jgi:hypothetical protein
VVLGMFQIEVIVNKFVNFWILHKEHKVSDQFVGYNLFKKHFDLCG